MLQISKTFHFTFTKKMENIIKNSEVFIRENLINYNDGAIVSRIIMKQNGGNLSVFAFDKNQSLSEHTAPFDAMIEILDGNAEIKINKISNFLKKGECIIMPANVPHAVNAIERFKMALTMIK